MKVLKFEDGQAPLSATGFQIVNFYRGVYFNFINLGGALRCKLFVDFFPLLPTDFQDFSAEHPYYDGDDLYDEMKSNYKPEEYTKTYLKPEVIQYEMNNPYKYNDYIERCAILQHNLASNKSNSINDLAEFAQINTELTKKLNTLFEENLSVSMSGSSKLRDIRSYSIKFIAAVRMYRMLNKDKDTKIEENGKVTEALEGLKAHLPISDDDIKEFFSKDGVSDINDIPNYKKTTEELETSIKEANKNLGLVKTTRKLLLDYDSLCNKPEYQEAIEYFGLQSYIEKKDKLVGTF